MHRREAVYQDEKLGLYKRKNQSAQIQVQIDNIVEKRKKKLRDIKSLKQKNLQIKKLAREERGMVERLHQTIQQEN
jgi:hypothetical protein